METKLDTLIGVSSFSL